MTDTNAKAFEEKLLTIDLIDGLRREQERLDLALNDGEQMKALRGQIQAYYQQAGIVVSDAVIDQAIAERQAQRYAFKPNKLGAVGRAVASCYVYRGRITASAAVLAGIVLLASFINQQISNWQQQRELDAYRAQLQQQLDAVQTEQVAVAKLPPALPDLASDKIPALPNWLQELQASYQQALLALASSKSCATLQLPEQLPLAWSGEAELASCSAALPTTQAASKQATQLVKAHQQLATAVSQYDLLQQRLNANSALSEWRAVASVMAETTARTAIGSDRLQFVEYAGKASQTLDIIAAVAGTHTRASSCLSDAVKESAGADRDVLNGLLGEGQAFKQASSIDGVDRWAKHADRTCAFFKTPITLRIVSEPGEKTGVWRYYDGNRGAKTYYIIVDAVTAGGDKASALIQSAEDQQQYERRRFGVRVNENTFEAIKRDKQDDGLLTQPEAGKKAANSLRWQLSSGFDSNFIAEW
ncbi:hypothetical protein HPT27_07960 [Permianibacter sp. IMCC34836]|uniref:DUF6384 family protein n=1 Tax=Permianibacter fluminis TaxID=2738515 RepID=UPI00155408DF|nr:DUF6384 family protein [Permianibacter fluminis]NQD36956.1 hypothetical protein [Permianibacter fluminis]